MRCEAGLQRLQPPTSAAHPVRESRAIDLDPVPGEDLALPGKRKVIAVLGDQDMSEKNGTGEALAELALRGERVQDGPPGPAPQPRPADTGVPQPCGPTVDHLAYRRP